MNAQELRGAVARLGKRAAKLRDPRDPSFGAEKNARRAKRCSIKQLKLFVRGICACLPILLTAKEEQSPVWDFLGILNRFVKEHRPLMAPCRSIGNTLKRFADLHEAWSKVESYAQKETETVDLELHGMAVSARRFLCAIQKKQFEIGSSRLRMPLDGQWLVTDSSAYSSAVGLTSGVHFFEALQLTPKAVQIGWKTRGPTAKRLIRENGLKHEYSPAEEQQFTGFHRSFPPGTVLGCLLNLTRCTFAFYMDGEEVSFQESVPFSSNPYYVSAKGAPLLYVNFGQLPYKYPPRELPTAYPTTDLASQANRYALYKQVSLPLDEDGSKPAFDPSINHVVSALKPSLAKEKQEKVRETLEQVWRKGDLSKESLAEAYAQLWKEERFPRKTYALRWLHAISEMESLPKERLNDWAVLIELMVDLLKNWLLSFEQYFLPYTKRRLAAGGESSASFRTLTIFFATLLSYNAHSRLVSRLSSSLSSSLTSFLLSAFLTTSDPCTAMFALVGLETVKKERLQEWKRPAFRDKLSEWKEKREATEEGNPYLAQLHLVIHHFERSFQSPFFHFLSSPAPYPATPTSLSPSKCSSQAKLSSDCLSLRSDFGWQSGRSHCSVRYSLSLPTQVFYFEATLLTCGPMRIGWATENWPVKGGTKLGETEYSFAYDGAAGCIWHQDVQWRVGNATKWQAGDVIGCLLDLALGEEKATFYRNGEPIQTNGEVHSRVSKEVADFSKVTKERMMFHVYEKNDTLKSATPFIFRRPYHAALSLGPYQQVKVNLGHTSFRFPPKNGQYLNFQQYSEHLEGHRPSKRFKSNQVKFHNVIQDHSM